MLVGFSPLLNSSTHRGEEPANVNRARATASATRTSRASSFFLWSADGRRAWTGYRVRARLRNPQVLEQQARRCSGIRVGGAGRQFAGQWLNLRGLQKRRPVAERYPDFDDHCGRRCVVKSSCFRQHRSRGSQRGRFADSGTTFVKERLDRHTASEHLREASSAA